MLQVDAQIDRRVDVLGVEFQDGFVLRDRLLLHAALVQNIGIADARIDIVGTQPSDDLVLAPGAQTYRPGATKGSLSASARRRRLGLF